MPGVKFEKRIYVELALTLKKQLRHVNYLNLWFFKEDKNGHQQNASI